MLRYNWWYYSTHQYGVGRSLSAGDKGFWFRKSKALCPTTKDEVELFKKHVEEFDIDCGFEELLAYLFSQTDEQTKGLEDIYEGCQKVSIDAEYVPDMPVNIMF
ncbi:MAG: hypothetical protein C4308_14795 [Chitinophagaceae bacterium]